VSAPTLALPSNERRPASDARADVSADVARPAPGRALRWAAWDVAVWTVVALLFAGQGAARSTEPFIQQLVTQLVGFLPCALFTPLVGVVALRYRFTEGARARAVTAHLLCLAAFLVVGGAMMGALEWSLPWHPVGAGIGATMREAVVRYYPIDTLIYVMIAAAILALGYGRESRERTLRAARLQQQLAEAQLHALGAQLHPHFLFYTLHVISALVRHEPKRAEELIARLSELLREMLESSDRVEIPLSEELAFLEKYVDIQEARFGPRLVVTFDVQPAEALDVPVPRLVLQPLVENAIRHGTARRSGVGTVDVRAECFGGRLTLVVRDDGAGLPPGGPAREGVGLSSTRARLQQLYGDDASLTIAPAPAGGTVCTVRMPCRRPAAPGAPARRGA
jgi:signal transduction histidine kinase